MTAKTRLAAQISHKPGTIGSTVPTTPTAMAIAVNATRAFTPPRVSETWSGVVARAVVQFHFVVFGDVVGAAAEFEVFEVGFAAVGPRNLVVDVARHRAGR